ncbi:MAG TPA: hypothetical protein VHU80_18740, partial [Polyangiaceae bacterium]|nr:hypothetical protein [Polyangiaceae bacterium]
MNLATASGKKNSLVRRLAGRVSLYTLALVAAGGVRILTVLLVVRVIPAATYGTYIALWVVLWGVHSGGDLGLGTAALRYAPECDSSADRRRLFATAVSIRAVAGTVLSGVVIAFSEPLSRWATGNAGDGRALVYLALSRPVAMVFEILSDELRARDEMGKVSALVVVSAVLVQGATVLLVVGAGLGLTGLIGARG